MIERVRAEAEQAFRLLDGHLASRPFVAGDTFTIGDIPSGIAAHRWLSLDIARPRLPGLERWYAALSERPGFREHVAAPLS